MKPIEVNADSAMNRIFERYSYFQNGNLIFFHRRGDSTICSFRRGVLVSLCKTALITLAILLAPMMVIQKTTSIEFFAGNSIDGLFFTILGAVSCLAVAGITAISCIFLVIVGVDKCQAYYKSVYDKRKADKKPKPKKVKKPSIVVEMYKSWKEKYCVPIKIIEK